MIVAVEENDDMDFDDDEIEDVSSSGTGESGVDPDLVKAVEKNLEKYKAKKKVTISGKKFPRLICVKVFADSWVKEKKLRSKNSPQ